MGRCGRGLQDQRGAREGPGQMVRVGVVSLHSPKNKASSRLAGWPWRPASPQPDGLAPSNSAGVPGAAQLSEVCGSWNRGRPGLGIQPSSQGSSAHPSGALQFIGRTSAGLPGRTSCPQLPPTQCMSQMRIHQGRGQSSGQPTRTPSSSCPRTRTRTKTRTGLGLLCTPTPRWQMRRAESSRHAGRYHPLLRLVPQSQAAALPDSAAQELRCYSNQPNCNLRPPPPPPKKTVHEFTNVLTYK